ncbi:MAG: hypothetical protein K2Y32_20195 [Candidatus Obscuribacterales bacterium]|nr:hypothetical protein [Candidatus Obscuribacterales bacterium]
MQKIAEPSNYSIDSHLNKNDSTTAGDAQLSDFVQSAVYPVKAENANLQLAAKYGDQALRVSESLTPAQQHRADVLDPQMLERAGKAMAGLILDKGRMDMLSQEGELMFLMAYQAYGKEGQAGVQKLMDAINKNLGGDFKLEMRNDPALTKKVIEEFTKKGETPPDFVGNIELKDKSGRPRGDVLFLYSKNSPGTRI